MHGCASVSWPARTYIHQFCANTGCCLEDLTRVMDDRDGWRARIKELRDISLIWGYIYIYIYIYAGPSINKENIFWEKEYFFRICLHLCKLNIVWNCSYQTLFLCFRAIQNDGKSNRVPQSWTEVAEECKPCEIYWWMCNVNKEACFSQKMFTNGLNVSLALRTRVEKIAYVEETYWLTGKEKISCAAVSKEKVQL